MMKPELHGTQRRWLFGITLRFSTENF